MMGKSRPGCLRVLRPALPLLLLGATASGAHAVQGVISTNTTWSGTVNVTGDVLVDTPALLRILPGTRVLFADSSAWDTTGGQNGLCDLIIRGRLIARGSFSDSVRFIPSDTSRFWGSLFLRSTQHDTLQYSVIDRFATSGLDVESSDVYVSSCAISRSALRGEDWAQVPVAGLYARHSTLTLDSLLVTDICGQSGLWQGAPATGLAFDSCPDIRILNCRLERCVGGEALIDDWSSRGGDADGVSADYSSLRIVDSRIVSCHGGASRAGGGGHAHGVRSAQGTLRVDGTCITDCWGGEGCTDGEGAGVFYDDSAAHADSSYVRASSLYDCGTYSLMNVSSGTLDCRRNYWGTVLEDTLLKRLRGNVLYSPWTDSLHVREYQTASIHGEIARDTTWRGTVRLNGDIHVPEGVTLRIEPGTQVNAASGSSCWEYPGAVDGVCDLIVDGSVRALGRPGRSITIGPSDTLGTWGGIWIRGDSDDTLLYVRTGWASTAILCDSASPLISECDIARCIGLSTTSLGFNGVGVSCHAANPTLRGDTIRDCWGGSQLGPSVGGSIPGSGFGLVCVASSPVLTGTWIHGCHGGNAPQRTGNGIGVSCSGDSRPVLAHSRIFDVGPGSGEWPGPESWGTGAGIAVSDSSCPMIGGSESSENEIDVTGSYDDYPAGTIYAVVNYTANDIIATWNWWGTTNPDSIALLVFDHADDSTYGRVIYEPWAEEPLGVAEPTVELPAAVAPALRVRQTIGRQFSIELAVAPKADALLAVYDLGGRRVRSLPVMPSAGAVRQVLWDGCDASRRDLPAGVYFLRLETQGRGVTAKVVKVR